MATDDSYEIMPYKEIVELKKQIAALQEKTGDTSSKELLNSMAALTKSMNNMLQLFSSAAEEMKLEEKTESELSHKIAPLMDKIDKLDEQSKTIAEGLVAVADMVKDIRAVKHGEEHKPDPPKHEKPLFEDLPPLEEEPSLKPPKPTKPMPPPGAPSFPPHAPIRIVPRNPMSQPGMPPGPPPGMPPMPPHGMPPEMPPPGGPMPPPDLGPLPPLPPLDEEPKKKQSIFKFFKKK